jgi:hypothetical protein
MTKFLLESRPVSADPPRYGRLSTLTDNALIELVYGHLLSFRRVATWTLRLRTWHLGRFLGCVCEQRR